MEPPPPPSREEAPAEKRPLDAADDPAEVAAKKQRLADPSSPIDPKDVEGLKDEHRQEAIAQREAAAKAKIQAEAEERMRRAAGEQQPEQAAHYRAARLVTCCSDASSCLRTRRSGVSQFFAACRVLRRSERWSPPRLREASAHF